MYTQIVKDYMKLDTVHIHPLAWVCIIRKFSKIAFMLTGTQTQTCFLFFFQDIDSMYSDLSSKGANKMQKYCLQQLFIFQAVFIIMMV